MPECRNCGKEWTKDMAPGTPEKPVSGFHFNIPEGERTARKGSHPFDLLEILGCPDCKTPLPASPSVERKERAPFIVFVDSWEDAVKVAFVDKNAKA